MADISNLKIGTNSYTIKDSTARTTARKRWYKKRPSYFR
jgi:hypothetical protein